MVIHEPSNTTAHWTLLQYCICNFIPVSLAMTSRPHNFEFCFTFVKQDIKAKMIISAVTVHDTSIPPDYPTPFEEGYKLRT